MKLTYNEWQFLHSFSVRLDQIILNQHTYQRIIMDKFDELLDAANEAATQAEAAATAAKAASDAIPDVQAAIDEMEKRITALLTGVITPAQMAKVQSAIDAARAATAAAKKVVADAAKTAQDAAAAAADARDQVDESELDPPTSFADLTAFTAGVAAYQGSKTLTLDAAVVKQGSAGQIDYFTHSDSTPPGAINTTGPTS